MPYNKQFKPVPKDKQFLGQKDIPNDKPYRIRILSERFGGYKLWIDSGERGPKDEIMYKPKVVTDCKDYTSEDYKNAQRDDKGAIRQPQEFFAAALYDYQTENIKVGQFSARNIIDTIDAHEEMPEYLNDCREWDIVITKTGQGLLTEYKTVCMPPKPLDATIATIWSEMKDGIDLSAPFRGEYPMKSE